MPAFTDDEALAWAEAKATDLANGSYWMEGVKLHTLVEHTKQLREVAKAYEAWEADLILNGDWSGECVRMTQAQHDRMMEIQAMRNAALQKPGG